MKSKIFLLIFYIIFIFNSNLFSNENNKKLKVGLLAPSLWTMMVKVGNSLLYSLQLALEEINDKNVIIVPRDSGFNDKDKLINAINDLRSSGVKVVIGPTTFQEFDQIKKYNDLVSYFSIKYKSKVF
jgi:basic membrane lipoprotein Med (substrate-binding protein (PBP1-ABC) superfamily)